MTLTMAIFLSGGNTRRTAAYLNMHICRRSPIQLTLTYRVYMCKIRGCPVCVLAVQQPVLTAHSDRRHIAEIPLALELINPNQNGDQLSRGEEYKHNISI